MRQLTFGSLFAGIGGFDLGFERAGLKCQWQVEIDTFCQRVLAKHWPNVRRYPDVRDFPPQLYPSFNEAARDDLFGVDVICGGFPCQDISEANHCGRGLAGERSGLWSEFARIIRLLRPRYAVIENVAAITFRGLGTVLGDIAEIGFDAEWSVISACSMGAPHMRDRVFIVAYPAAPGRRPIFAEGRDVEGDVLLQREGREAASWGGIPHALCDRPWTVEPALYGVVNGLPKR